MSMMQIRFPNSSGLDVHKKTVVASVITGVDDKGDEVFETRTFSTVTKGLLQLSDWLHSHGITHVAMESTGEYWKPVYNILEGEFELLLANANHVKNVPGRKTDVNDSRWLTLIMTYGLIRASFVPPQPQRELREMTRARAGLVRSRASQVNRLHKTLESANIKLGSVVSDMQGASAREMLKALIADNMTPEAMADLAKRRMRSKIPELEEALDGRVLAHHRFILAELLGQIDSLDEAISRFDTQIEQMCRSKSEGEKKSDGDGGIDFETAVAHLETVPGVGRRAAQQIIAEIGTDMSRFPSSRHLCAWAGVAPANHESAGKKLRCGIRFGNMSLRGTLIEAANAVKLASHSYLCAQYHRLAVRIGKKRATVAVAHSILTIIYHLLQRGEDYVELGDDYFDKRKPQHTASKLVKRLEALGFHVQLSTLEDTALITAAV